MSKKEFSVTEKKIRDLFKVGTKTVFEGKEYTVILCEKPRPSSGECKTDVYILLENGEGNLEVKISVKQTNADFLENKINYERAKEIFGDDAENVLSKSIQSIKESFEKQYLIVKEKYGRTEAKSIKLGWKFELLNKLSGELSGEVLLSEGQLEGVYSGSNLSEDKRDAIVKGEKVVNSGVANYILVVDPKKEYDANECLKCLCKISDYVKRADKMYFACKALNYRVSKSKWDGDRPLAVYVKWEIVEGKLKGEMVFSEPLRHKGNEIATNLKGLLSKLGISDKNFDSIIDKLDGSVSVFSIGSKDKK